MGGVGAEPPTGLFHLNMLSPSKLKAEIAPMLSPLIVLVVGRKVVNDSLEYGDRDCG